MMLKWIPFLLFFTPIIHAENFCVSSNTELQNTLDLADSNGQNDSIKIEAGNYLLANIGGNRGLVFDNHDGDHTLNISGGWLSVFSDCDAQPSGNSQATVLDGENTVTPLLINSNGTAANFTIENITFISGLADINNRGGGLNFQLFNDYQGNITLSRNQFIANKAGYGAALSLGGGNRIHIKNNLFVGNNASNGYNVELIQNDHEGIYFTNNTVINNTGAGFRVAANGSSQIMVANNILWNNEHVDLAFAGSGAKYLYYNNIGTQFNSANFESGNFSESPVFAAGGFLEFIPALSSAMINGGYTPFPFPFPPPFQRNWTLGTEDVLGKNRVQDSRVDIGAFEAAAESPIFADGFE